MRADARPVSRPCQNGELTDRASSSGHVGAHPVEQADALARAADADVDVEAEGGLAPGELAHRAVDGLVARARGHHGLVPDRRRVGAGGGGAQAERAELAVECAAAARAARRRAPRAVRCTPVPSSSAEVWVSGVTCASSSGGRRGSTRSICWASDQSCGLRSMTSSSAPSVYSLPPFQTAQAGSRPAHAARSSAGVAEARRGLDEAAEERRLLRPGGQRLGVPLHADEEVAARAPRCPRSRRRAPRPRRADRVRACARPGGGTS